MHAPAYRFVWLGFPHDGPRSGHPGIAFHSARDSGFVHQAPKSEDRYELQTNWCGLSPMQAGACPMARMKEQPNNERPRVDAGWALLLATERQRPRTTQAELHNPLSFLCTTARDFVATR